MLWDLCGWRIALAARIVLYDPAVRVHMSRAQHIHGVAPVDGAQLAATFHNPQFPSDASLHLAEDGAGHCASVVVGDCLYALVKRSWVACVVLRYYTGTRLW